MPHYRVYAYTQNATTNDRGRMMKLVEILARELKEWPQEAAEIAQDANRCAHPYSTSAGKCPRGYWDGDAALAESYSVSMPYLASDHATAIATRADWEAERARIAKPAKKADKDGWIRHRGAKCPVDAGVLVDVRCRDGSVHISYGDETFWSHGDKDLDIMAYRIHKPADQPVIEPDIYADDKDECSEPLQVTYHDADGPLQWRDRIREIDHTVEALEEERVSLIQRLECEGLQLLPAKVCAPAHHAYDWQVSSVTEGKFIQAIKQHRNLYGSGLKEAKEAVEQYRDANTPSA